MRRCATCEAELSPSASRCRACGSEATEGLAACPACGQWQERERAACLYCGEDLHAPASSLPARVRPALRRTWLADDTQALAIRAGAGLALLCWLLALLTMSAGSAHLVLLAVWPMATCAIWVFSPNSLLAGLSTGLIALTLVVPGLQQGVTGLFDSDDPQTQMEALLVLAAIAEAAFVGAVALLALRPSRRWPRGVIAATGALLMMPAAAPRLARWPPPSPLLGAGLLVLGAAGALALLTAIEHDDRHRRWLALVVAALWSVALAVRAFAVAALGPAGANGPAAAGMLLFTGLAGASHLAAFVWSLDGGRAGAHRRSVAERVPEELPERTPPGTHPPG